MVVHHVLIITFVLTGVHGQQNCSSNWFGPGCKFQCHCVLGQCDRVNGLCPNNVPCEIGYFGPACQYRNLLNTEVSVPGYFKDNSDTSCNPNASSTSITLPLSTPSMFGWMRLYVRNKELLTIFTTTFNGSITCSNERKFKFSENILDIVCDLITVNEIKIEGAAVPFICSIYVSEGRNVALKQSASQTSTFVPTSPFISGAAENAVDGNTNQRYENGSCTHTLPGGRPAWILRFNRPVVLYKIVIYNRDSSTYRLKRAVIIVLDSNHLAPYTFTLESDLSVYSLTVLCPRPVASLTINQSLAVYHTDRVLNLCEVETYGDPMCPENQYGLSCNQTCSCKNTDVCNSVTGNCTAFCPEGFYGMNCSLKCSRNCQLGTCALLSGKCNGCLPGYMGEFCDTKCAAGQFGPSCSSNCSESCVDVCDAQTGRCTCQDKFRGIRCTECDAGLFGPSCSLTCSDNCVDVCHSKTGQCSCKQRFSGDQCTDCSPGFFGADCKDLCPSTCRNETCEKDTGKCFACKSQYSGDLCKPGTRFKTYWNLFLLIPLIFVIFLCCVFSSIWYCKVDKRPDSTSTDEE